MKNVTIFLIVCALLFAPTLTFALPLNEVIEAVADRLVDDQYNGKVDPQFKGTWLGEEGYTGSIVAGLIQAYQVKGKTSYKEAIDLGVGYILDSYGGNFYGDEAYALARLTEVTGDQVYAGLVLDFYEGLDTSAYIRGFNGTVPEKAVFFISYHAVAAHMVGATDAGIWREAIINYLSQVDDDVSLSFFPVMTLGVATWALAQTGPLDDTMIRINPFGLTGTDYWEGVKLSDLPDLLASHQVLSGEHAGSFYVRFDHTSPGPGYNASGYTEDAVFGLLGLIAADRVGTTNDAILDSNIEEDSQPNWDFNEEIQNAKNALAEAVKPTGFVHGIIWSSESFDPIHYVYGGELLQTLEE